MYIKHTIPSNNPLKEEGSLVRNLSGQLLGCVSGGHPGFKARRKCREGRTEEETS